ncbi:sodium:proton exchanger [Porphyromonas crevioricanis]|uniref:Inner membrane protein yrbG n=2 Tax=Porphyromonas crevioricanis TaxID=393921 RepID=A0A0A2FFA4_9PORP|nr:calcium/sodium antiporter [Porphyromonas crevioricanis]KGN88782.1 sodium:proton exchanger [Porphyromonas crevioricanis]SJZ93938.1 cation:H+ antiporter [Porphyromonas crevioricanis]SQH73599.1 Inner membrane protein yrbG [Porphyromonas crevioricanis]GAD05496.1 inner membrane protein YrbG, predicted calcium/sodium:proton antiporter [Porphyromonas crevioricanis JCM 15906]GAD07722.1 inner membrane protein YrbG, predicted calcium/sodium:proton antiporter [Porphyromonas crevioricanis JCM 13913]
MSFLLLIIGLILVVGGAHYLTDGASSIAHNKGVSPLVIGLTVVAFGTSAPELAVSVSSALQGSGDIAVGNVVGSNILNILLIGGLSAIISTLSVSRSSIKYEIPMCLLFSILLSAMCLDHFLGGGVNQISRFEGMMLLLCFFAFFGYTFWITRQSKRAAENTSVNVKSKSTWLSIILVGGGLAGLIFGGDLFVKNAIDIARQYKVPESVIGLTIVAIGTSLPELATSVIAAIKGEHDIAIGNIVGSNIFNMTLILGTSACITPLSMSGISWTDLLVMIIAVAMLFLFSLLWGERKINRVEGTLLLITFTGYMYFLLSSSNI